MMDAMSANEGYDPFDLTGMTEEEFEQLEAAGEPVSVLQGKAPVMTRVGTADDVHGVHLEYFTIASTVGFRVVDVQVVQSTSMGLVGATRS